MTERDKVSFPCYGVSLSVETLDLSMSDIHRMAGLLPLRQSKMMCLGKLQSEDLGDGQKDEWREVPVKILIGNGVNWCTVISVDLGTAGKPWYERTRVQPKLLELFQSLPVCVGVNIKRTCISLITEFYGTL